MATLFAAGLATLLQDASTSLLGAWESFYVITGSSAAALTGLMFVVVSLVAETPMQNSDAPIAAFSTPTVVHLCVALLVSVTVSAPWHSLTYAGSLISLTGVAGMVYAVIVVRRARRQTQYKPVFEDWIWHAAFPFAAYLTLTVAGALLGRRPTGTLFCIGTATVVLLFIGIHNAWDTVIYLAVRRMQRKAEATK